VGWGVLGVGGGVILGLTPNTGMVGQTRSLVRVLVEGASPSGVYPRRERRGREKT